MTKLGMYSSHSLSCPLKKWIPTIKEQWVVVKMNVEPHVQSLSKKTIEVYEASKSAVTPHVERVHEFIDPHFQVYIIFFGSFLFIFSTNMNLKEFLWVTGS
jgi:hypothetical protein